MLKRYSRNIALSEIGQDGQELLLDSSVLVIGAGGLGSPVMLYLAAAGVGTIGIIDSDRVELSNLQRQILYGEDSVGKSKVLEAARRIKELNPDVEVITHKMRFGLSYDAPLAEAEAAARIPISEYDIIADCSDNFSTRFIINDACIAHKKTLVSTAVTGFTGQVATFKPHLGEDHPCYRCFCPQMPDEGILPNCSSGGVLGSVAGVIGSIQATEIIKELLGVGTSLSGSIFIYDGLKGQARKVRLKKNIHCPGCAS